MAVFVATGGFTAMVNVPLFDGSTVLVAVMVSCVFVVTLGGVTTPVEAIAPALVVHVTDCDGELDPATTAVHAEVAVVEILAGEQLTVTTVMVELGAATVTVAVPDFVGSATLAAVIVEAPTALAVKTPAEVIDPPFAVHVTDCDGEFEPVTMAVQVEAAPTLIAVGAQDTVTLETVADAEAIVRFAEPDLVAS